MMTDYVKQETNLDGKCQKAYAIIFGQCTENMRLELEAQEDYQRMKRDYNMFLLAGAIKGLIFKFDGHNHPSHAFHDAKVGGTYQRFFP